MSELICELVIYSRETKGRYSVSGLVLTRKLSSALHHVMWPLNALLLQILVQWQLVTMGNCLKKCFGIYDKRFVNLIPLIYANYSSHSIIAIFTLTFYK